MAYLHRYLFLLLGLLLYGSACTKGSKEVPPIRVTINYLGPIPEDYRVLCGGHATWYTEMKSQEDRWGLSKARYSTKSLWLNDAGDTIYEHRPVQINVGLYQGGAWLFIAEGPVDIDGAELQDFYEINKAFLSEHRLQLRARYSDTTILFPKIPLDSITCLFKDKPIEELSPSEWKVAQRTYQLDKRWSIPPPPPPLPRVPYGWYDEMDD